MTDHADISRVYPNLHRKVVLLGAHIETLPEGAERDEAQAISGRMWAAMSADEVTDEGYPDSETESTRRFSDLDNPTIEIEERDHEVTTPEGARFEWTATSRRVVPAEIPPRTGPPQPVIAAGILAIALEHLEHVRELALDLAAEQTPLSQVLLEGLLVQLDETGDFIDGQLNLPEADRGVIPPTIRSHLKHLELLARRLLELGSQPEVVELATALWRFLQPWLPLLP